MGILTHLDILNELIGCSVDGANSRCAIAGDIDPTVVGRNNDAVRTWRDRDICRDPFSFYVDDADGIVLEITDVGFRTLGQSWKCG